MMHRRTLLLGAAGLAAAPALAPAAGAWPSRAARMIIPWPPGQSTDLQGRLVAQMLTQRLGQNVVPENKAGAGGQIGTDFVAKAPPDGYTMLAASIGPITFSPLVQRTRLCGGARLRAGRLLRHLALHAAGAAGLPGGGCARASSPRCGRAGQVHLCLLRHRRGAASADRGVPRPGRDRCAAHPLPGQRPGDGGLPRRPGGLSRSRPSPRPGRW